MRLPNPNEGKPFERVIADAGGNPRYGIRREHTPDEEIVDLHTNLSNQQYWQPEKVLDPTGCEHAFLLTDVGRREIECQTCHFATTFHPGINYTEDNGIPTVTLKTKVYHIALP